MPGAGAGRFHPSQSDTLYNPHDTALFFQAPPATPPKPLSNKRSYDLHDRQAAHLSAPPPIPPLPPNYPRSRPNSPGPLRSAPAHVNAHVVPRLPPKIPVSRPVSAHPNATTDAPSSAHAGHPDHSRNVSVSSVDMAKAVAMSLVEAARSNPSALQEQEDLELERALKESLSMSDSALPSPSSRSPQQRLSITTTSTKAFPPENSDGSHPMTTSPNTMLTVSFDKFSLQSPSKDRRQSLKADGDRDHTSRAALQEDEERRRRQLEEDERLARMLAEEDQPPNHSPVPLQQTQSPQTIPSLPSSDLSFLASLPRYEDAVRENARPRGASPSRPAGAASGLTRGSSSCIASVGGEQRPGVQNGPPMLNGDTPMTARNAHGVGAVGLSGRSVSAHPIPSSHEFTTIEHPRPGPSPLPHGGRAISAPAPATRNLPSQPRLETVVEQGLVPNAPLTAQQNAFPPRVDSVGAGLPLTTAAGDMSEIGEGRPRASSQSSSESASQPEASRVVVPIEDELLMGVCE